MSGGSSIVATSFLKMVADVDPQENPTRIETAAEFVLQTLTYPLFLDDFARYEFERVEPVLLQIIRKSLTGSVPKCEQLLGTIYAKKAG